MSENILWVNPTNAYFSIKGHIRHRYARVKIHREVNSLAMISLAATETPADIQSASRLSESGQGPIITRISSLGTLAIIDSSVLSAKAECQLCFPSKFPGFRFASDLQRLQCLKKSAARDSSFSSPWGLAINYCHFTVANSEVDAESLCDSHSASTDGQFAWPSEEAGGWEGSRLSGEALLLPFIQR